MSVALDESFDEPPSVVSVVLAHAIEAAGWQLVHVSPTAELLVWEVRDSGHGPATLQAVISAEGEGAHVVVTSHHDEAPPPTGLEVFGGSAAAPAPDLGAAVLDFRPRRGPRQGPLQP